MAETKIDWADYSLNPVKGLCPMGCTYCYARRLYKRFKWDETIKWNGETWLDFYTYIQKQKEPCKIFVGSTMELFGEWIKPEWLKSIFMAVNEFPQHTFIFLTKRPENLIKWSPFPPNVWVGVSATCMYPAFLATEKLRLVKAKVKFLSCEPLQSSISLTSQELIGAGINWILIGQQTPVRPSTQPRIEWIKEIVEAADMAKVPVFLKDNLNPLLITNNLENFKKYKSSLFKIIEESMMKKTYHLRQEFTKLSPEGK